MLQFFRLILLEINLVVGRFFCFEVVSHHLPEPLGGPAVSRKRPIRTCERFPWEGTDKGKGWKSQVSIFLGD